MHRTERQSNQKTIKSWKTQKNRREPEAKIPETIFEILDVVTTGTAADKPDISD